MKTVIEVPDKFKELFLPNHNSGEHSKFTPTYKAELKRRMLRGETITEDMLGVKTIVLKVGRISCKTMNDEIASIQDFFGEQGDICSTVFSSMIFTIQLMGLENEFKWNLSPCKVPKSYNRVGEYSCAFIYYKKT